MTIKLLNVLTGKKEPFTPVTKDSVKIYICGVTVYGRCHVGHLRCYLSFDAIIRYLAYKGYNIKYVRNFTDIDDKIINRAKEIAEGPDGSWTKKEAYSEYDSAQWEERFEEDKAIMFLAKEKNCHLAIAVADYFIKIFKTQDFEPFDLFPASREPRVSQHIDEVIKMIEKIISRGFAYKSGGDVYFDVVSYHEATGAYGKLSRRDFTQLLCGARVAPDDKKKNCVDFALWKKSLPGEPFWDSPFGQGRPGWHIECSAMSEKELGVPFDIHAGGKDLIFPHHENEIAQTEAALGSVFCNTWMHNGFVTVDGVKMSKSLGNFLTIKQALEMAPPEVWRLLILSCHYSSPIDLSRTKDDKDKMIRGTIDIAFSRLEYFYETFGRADNLLEENISEAIKNILEKNKDVQDSALELKKKFTEAMDDDFNTPKAMAVIGEGMKLINELCDMKAKEKKKFQDGIEGWYLHLESYVKIVREICSVLNLCIMNPSLALCSMRESCLKTLGIDKNLVLEKLKNREMARAGKDWKTSDIIRDELLSMGIQLKDGQTDTTWKVIRS